MFFRRNPPPRLPIHGFGVYHLTSVGASDATIRNLVHVSVSASSYHKSLIAKLSFPQILGYVDLSSISISDLASTVASYFDMSTAIAEISATLFFYVDDMSGVGFLTSKGSTSL